MLTNKQLAELLLDQRDLKQQLAEINSEIRAAVHSLGIPQEMLGKMSMYDFLDGYLVGQGMSRKFKVTQ